MLGLNVLTQALGDLKEDQVIDLLNDFVDNNPSKAEALEAVAACQSGMGIVGGFFENGDYFVGDLIFAGRTVNRSD